MTKYLVKTFTTDIKIVSNISPSPKQDTIEQRKSKTRRRINKKNNIK